MAVSEPKNAAETAEDSCSSATCRRPVLRGVSRRESTRSRVLLPVLVPVAPAAGLPQSPGDKESEGILPAPEATHAVNSVNDGINTIAEATREIQKSTELVKQRSASMAR